MDIQGVDPRAIVYLNGDYLPIGEARISVLDRGFIFGDGLYEVVPVYGSQPFRMAQHLARLQRNLAAIRLDAGLDAAQWEALVAELLERNPGGATRLVYIQVTRGVAKRDHGFPAASRPTLFCMVSPFSRPSAAQRDEGLSVVPIDDLRWLRCDIKSISLLGNVLARQAAVDAGADEVVQFRGGHLTEGSASNIWVVRDGTLLAPPSDHLVLEGIRYAYLQELATQAGIPWQSRPITRAEVEQADELLMSSATREVLPITRYDGRPVGNGRPGPVYRRLQAHYDAAVDALMP